MSHLACFNCKKEISLQGSIHRKDECPYCRADMRVCRNCDFYDPKVYNECRETQAEVVKEKERSNFCDHFRPGQGAAVEDSAAKLREAAEALFKKSH